MGKSSIKIKTILGDQALPLTLYALFYSFHAFAFSLQLNVWFQRIFYGLYLVMTAWFFLKVLIQKNKSAFLRILVFFLVLIIIYGVVAIIYEQDFWKTQDRFQRITFIQIHFESILPIFVFYYFSDKGILKPSWFSVMFIIFCIDAFLDYRYHINVFQEKSLVGNEGFTNNSGYMWAALLPMVAFLDKKKVFQYLGIGVIAIFVIMCFKRGAMLISVLGILYFIFMSTKKNRNRITVIFLGTLISVIIYYTILQISETNDFFMLRYELTLEGDSSGRDSIYSFFWHYFFSIENGMHVFLGNGAFSTYRIYGVEAHNDWLEYAIDMGIFGFVVYAIIWVRVGKNYFYYAKHGNNQQILMAMGMVVIMNFIRSFMSMSLNNLSFFSAAVLGYTMAISDTLRKGIQIKDI